MGESGLSSVPMRRDGVSLVSRFSRCESAGTIDANENTTVADPVPDVVELVFFEGLFVMCGLPVGKYQDVNLVEDIASEFS